MILIEEVIDGKLEKVYVNKSFFFDKMGLKMVVKCLSEVTRPHVRIIRARSSSFRERIPTICLQATQFLSASLLN